MLVVNSANFNKENNTFTFENWNLYTTKYPIFNMLKFVTISYLLINYNLFASNTFVCKFLLGFVSDKNPNELLNWFRLLNNPLSWGMF